MKIVVLRTERENWEREREPEQNKSKPAWYSVCYDSTLLLSTTTFMPTSNHACLIHMAKQRWKTEFSFVWDTHYFYCHHRGERVFSNEDGTFSRFTQSLSLSCCEGWMALLILPQRTSEQSKKQKKQERERKEMTHGQNNKNSNATNTTCALCLIALHDFCIFLCL